MKKYLPILRRCALFRHIDEDSLLTMLGCLGAKVALFDKKYTVFAEGSAAHHIGVVLSGSIQIVRVDLEGNRSILAELGEADSFGEAFACAGVEALPVAVIANEPAEVMLLDCRHILHTCENRCGFHQQLIFNLMQELAAKVMDFHQKIEVISRRTTREKLLTYLQIQAKEQGSNRFTIPFDRQELADYLEVERSGLSAEISKLRAEGVLDSHRKEFVLF